MHLDLEDAFYRILQFGFRHHAGNLVDHLAVLEKDEGGYRLDTIFPRGGRIIVHVAFRKFYLLSVDRKSVV